MRLGPPMVTVALQTNHARLQKRLSDLATIGQLSSGGVRRTAYSLEDLAARQQVIAAMKAIDMDITIDAAGNIIGRYSGIQDLPALATGSHIDTVPAGGRYDGALGVLAGIEVVATLHEAGQRLHHPIEVIVFTDEEGEMIGSKAMAGAAHDTDPECYRRLDGTSIQTCLHQIGGDWHNLTTAQRTSQDIAAYLELHVEQGGVLEARERQIGVVQGIVGLQRYLVTIMGRPNHAGTTPMDMRQDALYAASLLVAAVHDVAVDIPGNQVATVGYLNVIPNAANIVPGQVDLTIDLRDLSLETLGTMVNVLQQRVQEIEAITSTQIQLERQHAVDPTLASPKIQETITTVCNSLQLNHYSMPSRAIHDAQEIGRFTQMGMIFVPSQSGVSHAEDEYTSPEQCGQGADVLLHTLLQLDEQGVT
ncbi:Zn-dependent hydrolase [Leptolyngbyaceae cyanobacterium CCMR0082]|uniref:Zn-dependent hydrolase n=1 Tax=Adonisia turfae CCMR0082 TaxID=2304604 RepID=A0A6M0SFV6_9CYAN|nr:Zn-dependent hydrolase [Adonisia turfae]NEZ66482.1 Zn-dependent hydrolase [Adonisia turfae CCMR0082]